MKDGKKHTYKLHLDAQGLEGMKAVLQRLQFST